MPGSSQLTLPVKRRAVDAQHEPSPSARAENRYVCVPRSITYDMQEVMNLTSRDGSRTLPVSLQRVSTLRKLRDVGIMCHMALGGTPVASNSAAGGMYIVPAGRPAEPVGYPLTSDACPTTPVKAERREGRRVLPMMAPPQPFIPIHPAFINPFEPLDLVTPRSAPVKFTESYGRHVMSQAFQKGLVFHIPDNQPRARFLRRGMLHVRHGLEREDLSAWDRGMYDSTLTGGVRPVRWNAKKFCTIRESRVVLKYKTHIRAKSLPFPPECLHLSRH